MYMNVTWGRIKAGMFSEYERIFLQPEASPLALPGFIARWLLKDLDDPSSGFTLSLWQSEDALNCYRESPTVQDLRDNSFRDLFIDEFSRYVCEVRIVSPGALDRLVTASVEPDSAASTPSARANPLKS